MEKLIHINAGHGGKDSGAVGNSLIEKEITLKLALKIGKILKEQGFSVSYTRIKDEFYSLSDIAKKANKEQADLFISIHCNAAVNTEANGIETFIYDKRGENEKIAGYIQKRLINATKLTDRGVKENPSLAVLNSTKMTAVLIEVGFLTNVKDAEKLKKEDFLNLEANAISEGICDYFEICLKKQEGEKNMQKRYQTIEQIPDWGKKIIQKLIEENRFGNASQLNLSEDMLRTIVILKRE